MKRRIFIRYFSDKNDQIPKDSNAIVEAGNKKASRVINSYECGTNIADWFERYPNGKVDFVIL